MSHLLVIKKVLTLQLRELHFQKLKEQSITLKRNHVRFMLFDKCHSSAIILYIYIR